MKTENLQETFLNQLRKEKSPVTIFLLYLRIPCLRPLLSSPL